MTRIAKYDPAREDASALLQLGFGISVFAIAAVSYSGTQASAKTG